jgi:two-component system, NtrC family, sensor kinase
VRFEMFANMVGLALENVRAYQDLERKVIERTQELREANRLMREKTQSLEKASYSLANANVQLLGMQEQLEKKNSEIQTVIEAAPVALILSRIHDGKVMFVNQNMADLMGVPIEEATSRVTQDYYFDLDDRKKVFKRLAENGSVNNYELRLRRHDGSLIWATLSVQKAEIGGEAVIIGGINDITERKKAEEALRESEERFRSLVENANDIIYSLTPEGQFSYVSPQWKWILGHDISEVMGKGFKHFVHAEDYPKCLDYFEKIMDTGVRQSGLEYRIQHKNGQWRWHTTNASVMHNDKGQIVSFIGICHDMTLNKKVLTDLADAYRNLRQTQSQLVQSEKMASLGMLVAGIAHEINTPIAAIKSMHDTLIRAVEKMNAFMQSRYPDALEDPRLKIVAGIVDDSDKVINSGIERVTNIVKRLRSFARLDEADLKTVDIHEGLEDTLSLLHHELKNKITVNKEYGNIPQIAVFPGRLNQVFLNILMNARQAIKDTGEITIRTFLKDGKVHVAISDTGSGIPPEDIKRLFDPGFTTKGVGVGTGLGLSICYQIVQDHRGEITVESEVGKGSTFTIILPTDLQVR